MRWEAVRSRLEAVRSVLDEGSPEYKKRILNERARVLALPADDSGVLNPEAMLLVFRIGPADADGHKYGILLREIAEVIPDVNPAVVPGAPPEVAGLIQVRGDIVPVYHLLELLRRGISARGGDTAILLRSGSRVFGLLATGVEEVRAVEESARRSVSRSIGGADWMTDDLIMVLDSKSLANQINVHKEV